MADVLVLLAHPDLARSRVNRAFAAAARSLAASDARIALRDLYALYPDYLIDVEAEQQQLAAAHSIVWLHPIQWYAMPPLMKLWVDEVFTSGWAYGDGGTRLAGKSLWLAVSTGGVEAAYAADGSHQRPFDDFLPPYIQTAALCGMRWLAPSVVHGAHQIATSELEARARAFGERLRSLAGPAPGGH